MTKERFTQVYQSNAWGSNESKSVQDHLYKTLKMTE